jgi:heat shock protein 4
MKLLVGRKFSSPDVQKELAKQPYKAVATKTGGVGIVVTYNDEPTTISAEHFLAMMLVKAKEIGAKANNNVMIGDAALAVPHNFTDAQRKALLHACEIAQINCIKITNESNAIALSYGIFKSAKKLFSDTEPQHIMFIDLGYTSYSVTIVAFTTDNMKVLSTVCDRNLGGRDFDDVIIEFLAETFQKKTGIDVRKNVKAILKLQVGAEKAKKTLSPNGVTEANVSVECLAEEKDLACILTKDEMESRCAKLISALEQPITKCLAEAGLTKEQLTEIEIVGGGSRVNCVKKRLGEILGLDPSALNYGLKTTMNADEAVARGAALQCAMLSSRMKVKAFNIIDKLPYGIVAHYDADSSASSSNGAPAEGEEAAASGSSAQIYTRNYDVPYKPRRLTFRKKTAPFAITLSYDDEAQALLPPGEDLVIAKYQVNVPTNVGPVDVRVTFNLDKHGCVFLQSAQMLEEVAAEEPAPPAAEAKEGAEPAPVPSEDAPAKKRFRKTDLDVATEVFGLTKEDIKASLELEATMANEDRLIIETADKRNELETYIYAMRDKLDDSLKLYASPDERAACQKLLTDGEDWLYGDGSEASKSAYAAKIEALKAVGNPIEARLSEENGRASACDSLRKQAELCKQFASNYDSKYEHITEEERDSLRKSATDAEAWLFDQLSKQADLPKYANPVLTLESISQRRSSLFSVSNPIMTKKPPAPAPTPAPAPAAEGSADGGAKDADADAKGDSAGAGDEGKGDKAEGKMDVEEDASGSKE